MQIAERVYSLAQEQNDPALLIGAFRILAVTLYFSGDFEPRERTRGVVLSSGGREAYNPGSKKLTHPSWFV